MTLYQYTAITQAGTRIAGEMEGSNPVQITEHLSKMGHYPIEVQETSARRTSRGWFAFRQSVPNSQITIFTRELALLLRSGLALDHALRLLSTGHGEAGMADIINSVRRQINDGVNFAQALEAMDNVFPPHYTNMIRVAEASGSLEAVLEQIAEAREKEEDLRGKIHSALLYPTVLIVTAVVLITMLFVFVVPQFKTIIVGAGDAIPQSTRLLMNTSDWLIANGTALLAALIALLIGMLLLKETAIFRNAVESFSLRLPVIRHFKMINLTIRACRTLGITLKAGVDLPDALELCERDAGAGLVAEIFAASQRELRKGQSFITPLEQSGLFFPVVISLLKVGEEIGNLAHSALYIAQIYENKLDVSIRRLMTILEPSVIIVVSIFVATIMIAILGAIIDVNGLVI